MRIKNHHENCGCHPECEIDLPRHNRVFQHHSLTYAETIDATRWNDKEFIIKVGPFNVNDQFVGNPPRNDERKAAIILRFLFIHDKINRGVYQCDFRP